MCLFANIDGMMALSERGGTIMRIPLVLAMAIVLLLCPSARAEEIISSPEVELLRAELEQFRKELRNLQAQHEKEVIELQGQIRELADEMHIQRETQEAEKEAVYHEFYQETQPPVYQAPLPSGRGL